MNVDVVRYSTLVLHLLLISTNHISLFKFVLLITSDTEEFRCLVIVVYCWGLLLWFGLFFNTLRHYWLGHIPSLFIILWWRWYARFEMNDSILYRWRKACFIWWDCLVIFVALINAILIWFSYFTVFIVFVSFHLFILYLHCLFISLTQPILYRFFNGMKGIGFMRNTANIVFAICTINIFGYGFLDIRVPTIVEVLLNEHIYRYSLWLSLLAYIGVLVFNVVLIINERHFYC